MVNISDFFLLKSKDTFYVTVIILVCTNWLYFLKKVSLRGLPLKQLFSICEITRQSASSMNESRSGPIYLPAHQYKAWRHLHQWRNHFEFKCFPCIFFWNIVWKVAVDFLYNYHMPKIDPLELGLEMMLLNWQIQAAHMYFDVEFVHTLLSKLLNCYRIWRQFVQCLVRWCY